MAAEPPTARGGVTAPPGGISPAPTSAGTVEVGRVPARAAEGGGTTESDSKAAVADDASASASASLTAADGPAKATVAAVAVAAAAAAGARRATDGVTPPRRRSKPRDPSAAGGRGLGRTSPTVRVGAPDAPPANPPNRSSGVEPSGAAAGVPPSAAPPRSSTKAPPSPPAPSSY